MSEKPGECSHCQKSIHVIYKEISNGVINCLEMCIDCPILNKKLQSSCDFTKSSQETRPKLCCEICMTTEENVLTGSPLGCSHCYIVFEKLLKEKLVHDQGVPSFFRTESIKASEPPLHRGKAPHQTTSFDLSSRLEALNKALEEAVKKELYEQAAWLRDQIKELKGKAIGQEKQSP